jgi:hypothetical protein
MPIPTKALCKWIFVWFLFAPHTYLKISTYITHCWYLTICHRI